MPRKYIGTAAAALTLGIALIAAGPGVTAPVTTSTAIIDSDSTVIPVARRGLPSGPAIRRGISVRRGIAIRRGIVVRPGFRGRIRVGWFRPGRRIWVLPAIGAAAVALTLAPGWYWGDYYDDCNRWIIPCPGCAPQLVDLCAPY